MKTVLVLLIFLMTYSLPGQVAKLDSQGEQSSKDTLNFIQGTWELNYLTVESNHNKVFSVMKLEIEKENFTIRFNDGSSQSLPDMNL